MPRVRGITNAHPVPWRSHPQKNWSHKNTLKMPASHSAGSGTTLDINQSHNPATWINIMWADPALLAGIQVCGSGTSAGLCDM